MKQCSYLVHLDSTVYFDLYLSDLIRLQEQDDVFEILIAEIWIFFYSCEGNYELLSFIYLEKNNRMTITRRLYNPHNDDKL